MSELLLNQTLFGWIMASLGALLAFAAYLAWGKKYVGTLPLETLPTDHRADEETPRTAVATPAPEPKTKETVVTRLIQGRGDEEPCAEERARIFELEVQLDDAIKQGEVTEGVVQGLREELAALKAEIESPKPKKRVATKNIAVLLANFSELNTAAGKKLSSEAKKPDPSYERIKAQLTQFARFVELCGYEPPDPGHLFLFLQKKLKE